MTNFISTAETENLNFKSDYDKQCFAESKKVIAQVETFAPCEAVHLISGGLDDVRYDYSVIYLQQNPFKIIIRYWEQYKKFLVHGDFKFLKNIDNRIIENAKEQLTEPKMMGVLSTKKIESWIKYYNDLYNLLLIENNKNVAKIEAFKETLEGQEVIWHPFNNSGVIVKNGLEFSFSINDTYISTKIELHYKTDSDLETFKKLSDNKF
jgi:hypothetical protein